MQAGWLSKLGAFFLLTACSAGTASSGETPDGEAEPTGGALWYRECGPTDGPATALVLTDGPATCADLDALRSGPHLFLEVWDGGLREGQSFTLAGAEGAATRCLGGGRDCQPLDGATLTVRAAGPELGATVTYRDGAETKTREFRAARCEVRQVCG